MPNSFLQMTFDTTLNVGTAALRMLPPELSHSIGMRLVGVPWIWDCLSSLVTHQPRMDLSCSVPGLGRLVHPVGLAAGFDKDCDCPGGFRSLGFSFVEIGTVTPKPQPGNPRPRLFRLRDEHALVNRMGFNGVGMREVSSRLRRLSWNHDPVPLGVNLGKNKTTSESDVLQDYLSLISEFHELSRYLVVNVSSPNTPGLRGFANEQFVRELLLAINPEQRRKVWLKLDPDLPRPLFQRVVSSAAENGVAGLVLTNTHRVEKPEAGGLSGHPLLVQSTARLEWAWDVHRGRLPMIGSGGVFSGGDVFQKLIRGANAVQVYTAFIYGGPLTVKRILSELEWELELAGFSSVQECIGSFYAG